MIINNLRVSSSCYAIMDLFTKGSHHKNLSVILISQNLFHQRCDQRDICISQRNYIVVFKNPHDRVQIRHLAHQVYPDDPKFLEEAYYDATSTARSEKINPGWVSISNVYFSRGSHYVHVPRRSFPNGFI